MSEFSNTTFQELRAIARNRLGTRQGGHTLQPSALVNEGSSVSIDLAQILTLDEAITRMEQLDPPAAEVLKLRFFAGLSVEEAASALGVSDRTVKREWSFARAWLAKELSTFA